jgi:hypothetical protein
MKEKAGASGREWGRMGMDREALESDLNLLNKHGTKWKHFTMRPR